MRILLCNPRNSQGTLHSRKGMYVPLGLLSIATFIDERFGPAVTVDVKDEDIEDISIGIFRQYDLVGFYATTFNYAIAVRYAYFCNEFGVKTVLGGPHASVLARNILQNRSCFDYIIMYEAEIPFAQLVENLLADKDPEDLHSVANIAFKDEKGIFLSQKVYENDLRTLPIPSRKYVDLEGYMANYRKTYPDKVNVRPGSIYSSKGCTWRDKTGGCVFCARLEEGVRFRNIEHIWAEIDMMRNDYQVNSIWDIADDNLNNKKWFQDFVDQKPESCKDLKFFIYSRVGCIKPWVFDYFEKLNVEEVFIGVESADNGLLRKSFKGQTRNSSFKAIKLLNDHNIRYYPSFVLGLPGESKRSLNNTLNFCKDIAQLGGLDRLAATIMKPIPGSRAFKFVLSDSRFGRDLAGMDDIDLVFLERYWIEVFTDVKYRTILDYRDQINEIMGNYQVFGSSVKASEQPAT